MADTIATLTDLRVAQILAANWDAKVGARGPESMFWGAAPIAYLGNQIGNPSNVVKVPIVGLGGLDRMLPRSENNNIALIPFSDGHYTITLASYYKGYQHTQEAMSTDSLAVLLASNPAVAVDEAIAARNSTLYGLVGALAPSFTAAKGTTSTAPTLADLQACEAELRAKSVKGPYVALLDPSHWEAIRQDIQTQSGTVWSRLQQSAEQTALKDDKYQGMVGSMMIFLHEYLPTAGPDTIGMVFGQGAVGWADRTVVPGVAAIGQSVGPMWLGFDRDERNGRGGAHFHDQIGVSIGQQDAGVKLIGVTP